MSKSKQIRYAIVEHSGFGYKGDVQFSGGLETRSVSTKAEIVKVDDAGGVIFNDYCTAEDFCDWAMYTASNRTGLIPDARKVGRFARSSIDQLHIFLPLAGVVDAFEADPKAPLARFAE